MTAATPKLASSPVITWPLLPDDFILPDDPVDNDEQYPLAGALTQALTALPHLHQNALMTTNFALCAGIDGRTICKAPDWMYVRPAQPWTSSTPRRSYTPHTQGPVPAVVMEFLSETPGGEYSRESGKKIGKWFFYEQVIQVPTYVICKPETETLEVYQLEAGRYHQQSPAPTGRYWIPGLELFLGPWQGHRDLRTGYWLRWWTSTGELLLWPEELAEQAKAEAEQAEAYAQQTQKLAQQAKASAQQAKEQAQQAEERVQQAEEQVQFVAEQAQQAEKRAQQAEEQVQFVAEQAQQAEGRAQQAEERVQQAEEQVQSVTEQAQQAEERARQAEARAAQLAAKLKAAGIDP